MTWKDILEKEVEKEYFKNLTYMVKKQYEQYVCYPPKKQIYSAFRLTDFEDIKVVILGQDPYHGVGQANGLAFSVNENIALPPSLVNIFKEISQDLNQVQSTEGDLTRWAKQGVFFAKYRSER